MTSSTKSSERTSLRFNKVNTTEESFKTLSQLIETIKAVFTTEVPDLKVKTIEVLKDIIEQKKKTTWGLTSINLNNLKRKLDKLSTIKEIEDILNGSTIIKVDKGLVASETIIYLKMVKNITKLI